MGVYRSIAERQTEAQAEPGTGVHRHSFNSEWSLLARTEDAQDTVDALLAVEEADSESGYTGIVTGASFQEPEPEDQYAAISITTRIDLLRVADPQNPQEEMEEAKLLFSLCMSGAIRGICNGQITHQADLPDNQAKAAGGGGGGGGSAGQVPRQKSRYSKDFIQDIIALPGSEHLSSTIEAAHRAIQGERYTANPLAERLIENSLIEMNKINPEGTLPIAKAYAEEIGLKQSIGLLGQADAMTLIVGVAGNIEEGRQGALTRLNHLEDKLYQEFEEMASGLCDPDHPHHGLARSLQMAGLAAYERKKLSVLKKADNPEAIDQAIQAVDFELGQIETKAWKNLKNFSETGQLPPAIGQNYYPGFALQQGIARSLINGKTRELTEKVNQSPSTERARQLVEELTGKETRGVVLAIEHLDWINTEQMEQASQVVGAANSRRSLILLPEDDCKAITERGEHLNPTLLHELTHTAQLHEKSNFTLGRKQHTPRSIAEHSVMEAATEMVATSIRRKQDPGAEPHGYPMETLVLEAMIEAKNQRLPSSSTRNQAALYGKLATQHSDRAEENLIIGNQEVSTGGYVRSLSNKLLQDTSPETEGLLAEAIEERLHQLESSYRTESDRERLMQEETTFWVDKLLELRKRG